MKHEILCKRTQYEMRRTFLLATSVLFASTVHAEGMLPYQRNLTLRLQIQIEEGIASNSETLNHDPNVVEVKKVVE